MLQGDYYLAHQTLWDPHRIMCKAMKSAMKRAAKKAMKAAKKAEEESSESSSGEGEEKEAETESEAPETPKVPKTSKAAANVKVAGSMQSLMSAWQDRAAGIKSPSANGSPSVYHSC